MFLQRAQRYSKFLMRPQAMKFSTAKPPSWLSASDFEKIKSNDQTQFLALRMGNADTESMNVRMIGGLEGNNSWFENYKISDSYEAVRAQNYKVVVVSSTPLDLANVTLDPEIRVGDGEALQIELKYNVDLEAPRIDSKNEQTSMTKMTMRAQHSKTEGYPNLAYAEAIFKKKS